MSDIPKDGIYTFKAGETLPNWCSFSPGAKIERGGVKCRVYNGIVGKWEILDQTYIEGNYYLYSKGNEIRKIHIKGKRRIKSEDKFNQIRVDKTLSIYIFFFLAFLILLISFLINAF